MFLFHFYAIWFSLSILLICVFIVRLWYIIPGFHRCTRSKNKRVKPLKSLIVLGSGGHTAEMFRMMKGLSKEQYKPRIYITAAGDNISRSHCTTFEEKSKDFHIKDVPRARKVGQSYWTSIGTTLYASLQSAWIVCSIQPDLIFCNGPGTCVPICAAALIPKFLGKDIQVIYVESICRVKDLSLSAKILYPLCNRLFVQWKSLSEKYPKTEYIGLLSS